MYFLLKHNYTISRKIHFWLLLVMRFHSATKKGEKPNEKTGMSKFSVIDILMQSNQRKEQDSHRYIIYIKVVYIQYKNTS